MTDLALSAEGSQLTVDNTASCFSQQPSHIRNNENEEEAKTTGSYIGVNKNVAKHTNETVNDLAEYRQSLIDGAESVLSDQSNMSKVSQVSQVGNRKKDKKDKRKQKDKRKLDNYKNKVESKDNDECNEKAQTTLVNRDEPEEDEEVQNPDCTDAILDKCVIL